jgi:2-dehydro-3-deoxyphosphogalactonate aldolase
MAVASRAADPDVSGAPAVIAILRGIRTADVERVAEVLIEAGIRVIEIPLNSPDPFASIARLHACAGSRCLIGAGTVLDVASVDRVAEAGARLVVAPNTNADVIRRARQSGMHAVPGFGTATEAFVALEAGARLLKLFPASTYGPAHVQALRSVLPADAGIVAVGGVGAETIDKWRGCGLTGFGVGGELYRPQFSIEEVGARARRIVAAARDAGLTWTNWGGSE